MHSWYSVQYVHVHPAPPSFRHKTVCRNCYNSSSLYIVHDICNLTPLTPLFSPPPPILDACITNNIWQSTEYSCLQSLGRLICTNITFYVLQWDSFTCGVKLGGIADTYSKTGIGLKTCFCLESQFSRAYIYNRSGTQSASQPPGLWTCH